MTFNCWFLRTWLGGIRIKPVKKNDIFYYCRQVSGHDYPAIETAVKGIVKEKQPFERLEMKKEDLLKMFEVRLSRYGLCNMFS